MSSRSAERRNRNPSEEATMPNVVVRYRTKADRAEENQLLIEKVFAELSAIGATGFSYMSFRLDDGVSFVHVVVEHDEHGTTSLADVPAFQAFTARIADRCDEQPVATGAAVVGMHGVQLGT
jgi:hypothetical protein